MHLITGTWNISVGFRLSVGAFYSSITTIGSNGITLILLVSIGDMKNLHCIRERRTYIVFSVCLGSQALRTKNIHFI